MHSLNQQLTLNKAPGNCATYCHCKCNWSELIHTNTNLSFVKCKKKVKTILWNHSYSRGQCSQIFKILLVSGDEISRVIGLWHYNTWQFISLLTFGGSKVTHKIHEHRSPMNNDDSTVSVDLTEECDINYNTSMYIKRNWSPKSCT